MRERFNVYMFCGLMLAGCSEFDPDPNNPKDVCPSSQIDMPTLCPNLDLAPPPPKCAAAKGLTGDALICVDFDKLSGLTDQALAGWNFVNAPAHPWEISSGKLQVNNFATFADTGSFRLPLTDLAAAANQKYQSVTLAVVQRVDLNDKLAQLQSEQLMMGLDDPARRIEFRTGSSPRQQYINAITRTDLASVNGVGANFQPLFKLTSAAAVGGLFSGVQIESIAVIGNP